MRAARRALLFIGVVAGIILSAPGFYYLFALHKVSGRPTPADITTSDLATAEARWRACGETGPIAMERENPWGLLYRLYTENTYTPRPGDRAVWLIVRKYNSTHLSEHRHWHPSGAALQIWVTRHWTARQVAATLVRDHPCTPRPPTIRKGTL